KPAEQVLLCTEVMAEARRNAEIARIFAGFDADVKKWLVDLLRYGSGRGGIPRDVAFYGVVAMLMIITRSVWCGHRLDPEFEPASVMPIFMDIARHMLRGARPKIAPTKPDDEENSR